MRSCLWWLVLLLATMLRSCHVLKLVILQHINELRRVKTATAPLLEKHGAEVISWSGRVDNERVAAQLASLGSMTLLWPGDGNHVDHSSDNHDRQDSVVCILDGTWQEAEQIYRKGPACLLNMKRRSIATTSPSVYRLRQDFGFKNKFGGARCLCTAEVGARLLHESGFEDASHQVLADLDAMQSNYHKIRSLPDSGVAGGGENATVYCLVAQTGRSTYVGATLDLDRRLRQHNGEIGGGAKATAGLSWNVAVTVKGFPSWSTALQFEWKWKQLTRKQPVRKDPLEKRRQALVALLELDKATQNALPFSEWASPPLVTWKE